MRKVGLGIGIVLAVCLGATTMAAEEFKPTRFTVVVEGMPNGPAVLLLPGLASSQAVFDAEAKLLAPTCRLYRVQVDGFAGEPAGANADGPLLKPIVEELHRYIAANKLHPAVIGHSMGGLLGLMLADTYPGDMTKLMMVDTLPFYALVFNPAATVETIGPQAAMMRDGMLKAPEEQFKAQSAQTAGFLVKDPEGLKLVAASSGASDRRVFVTAMYEDMLTDMRPRLAGIKTSTTLLYPYDPTLQGPDPAQTDALYAGAYKPMPNLTMHRLDGSRHFIMYDQPQAFAAAVSAFLK